MAYNVTWSDAGGSQDGTSLTNNAALDGQVSNAAGSDCDGGENPTATVAVEVAESELAAAAGGGFGGTLTLVVAPE